MHNATLALVLAVLPFVFDMQNGLSWWRGSVIEPATYGDGDYTILVPVFGSPRYFGPSDRAGHEPYKHRVLVTMEVSKPGMPEFADELRADGWNVWTCQLADACSPRLMYAALSSGVITTTYTIRMDADSLTHESIDHYIAAIRADGADLVSTKVHVLNPRKLVERFQAMEYKMAMLARTYRPMLTSGACYIGKTEALTTILSKHTYWWCGEDVEVGMIAKALKMRVRTIEMEVLTEAPSSWRSLFHQRRLWWAANFRHAIINADKNIIHRPMWTLYYVSLVWFSVVFKWDSLSMLLNWRNALIGFGAMWVIYIFVTLLSNVQVRSWFMLVFPPYSFVQVLLMPVVGLVWYIVMMRRIGNHGRYHFGYRRTTLEVTPSR